MFYIFYGREFTKYHHGTRSLLTFLLTYNFHPYNVLLANAKNIPMRLVTGFVIQGHTDRRTLALLHYSAALMGVCAVFAVGGGSCATVRST